MKFPPHIATSAILTIALSSVTITGTFGIGVTSRATVCNGHAELCDRSFGNVTFVGAHNSYAVGVDNLAVNQDYDITQQLNDGVRMLQSQAHNQNGVIQLCHTSCGLFDGGSLQSYLTTVKTWMDANPNDVVSLLIVNDDKILPAQYDTVFKAVGLDQMAYAPASASLPATDWPTLGSLIDSGKRLIVFLSTSADFNAVPYLINEFTNVWETMFDVTTAFDCEINRPSSGNTADSMFLINHFLDKVVVGFPAPDPDNAATTNAVSGPNSLGEQVQQCAAQHGRYPNFMLVDFYEYGGGSVFQVAANANGVTYSPATPVPPPKNTDSANATGNSTSSSPESTSDGNNSALRATIGSVGSVAAVGGMVLVGHILGVL